MKIAKSMYLGGIEVFADQIESYEDYKNLGLTCPYCNEAVFWRSRSEYKISSNKAVHRASCFAHFGSDTECVAKFAQLRKVCASELSQFKESKNQRLKIYNAHLWEMLNSSLEVHPKLIKKIEKIVGRSILEEFVKKTIDVWIRYISNVPNKIEQLENIYISSEVSIGELSLEDRVRILRDKDYFESTRFNKHIHRAICIEVCSYLAGATGRHILKKLLTLIVIASVIVITTKNKEPELRSNDTMKLALMTVFTTPWIREIENRLNK